MTAKITILGTLLLLVGCTKEQGQAWGRAFSAMGNGASEFGHGLSQQSSPTTEPSRTQVLCTSSTLGTQTYISCSDGSSCTVNSYSGMVSCN